MGLRRRDVARSPVLQFSERLGTVELRSKVEFPTERRVGRRSAELGAGFRWSPPGWGSYAAQRNKDL
eukprot:12450895-Alexandrium_andersonii.AAC.1